ncbi:hypothetical protein [Streptomyces sp. NPDC048309]|uniref:hypothetical protein n=1 Tax=Streptomyces sp. NPDC048309 TaxID=3154618 RepID=UPI0033C693A9
MSETKTPALQYRFDGPEDAPVLILGPPRHHLAHVVEAVPGPWLASLWRGFVM